MLGFFKPKVLPATMDAVQAGEEAEEARLTELMERRKASKLAVSPSFCKEDAAQMGGGIALPYQRD